jgi:hypothetical protein
VKIKASMKSGQNLNVNWQDFYKKKKKISLLLVNRSKSKLNILEESSKILRKRIEGAILK